MTGERLKKLLQYNNITVKEVAGKLGISRQCLESRLKTKSVKLELLEQIEACVGHKLAIPEFDEKDKNTDEENMLLVLKQLQEKTLEVIKKNAKQFDLLKEAKKHNFSLRREIEELLKEEADVSREDNSLAI